MSTEDVVGDVPAAGEGAGGTGDVVEVYCAAPACQGVGAGHYESRLFAFGQAQGTVGVSFGEVFPFGLFLIRPNLAPRLIRNF